MNQQFVQVLQSNQNQPNTGTLMQTTNNAVGHLSFSVDLVLVNEYGVRELTKSSERWLISTTKSLLKFLQHDPEIDAVNNTDVLEWMDYKLKQKVKPVTVNSYLRGLRTLYSRLNRLGYTKHDPTRGIKFLRERQKTPKAISFATYQKLLNVAEDERDKAILATLWATGCRLGGLISMDYNQVELWFEDDQPCIAIHVVEKYDKPRWVYVDNKEAAILNDWLQVRPKVKNPALFLTKRGKRRNHRLGIGGVAGLFKKLRQLANLSEGTISNPHSFRHAFAIRKLDEGYDIALVSQWLGHNDPAFTASVYAVRSEAQLRAAFFKKKK